MKKAARNVLRFAIAGILLATAIGKLLDVAGFAEVLDSYRALPEPALLPVAWIVPLAELALAAWLLYGRRLAAAALVAAAMHLAYGVWALGALRRGLDIPNCGCFGVFWARPLTPVTLVEDGVMVVASLALAWLARERPRA